MRIFAPLRHRPIAKLWSGQVLSSLGDEINRIATTWIAARLWGADAGRLMALYAACACVFSLAGGRLTDRASFRGVMIASDLARAAAVLLVPVGAAMGLPLGPLLVASVALCASLSALFEPAMRALTAALVPPGEARGPTNALMESTVRFARVLGPTLVAALGPLVPMLQFFTLDALTFVASALSIAWLSASPAGARAEGARGAREGAGSTREALRAIARDPAVRYALGSSAVVGAAWWLLLPLGMELLLQDRGATDLSALAGVMFAYGVGNLASNLLAGNLAHLPHERLLYAGRVLAGAGFLLFAAAPGRAALMASAALAAAGGPVTDVGLIGLLQSRFEGRALAQVYRVNLAVSYGAMCALFFASPALFRALGVANLFVASAATIALGGLLGFARLRAAKGDAGVATRVAP